MGWLCVWLAVVSGGGVAWYAASVWTAGGRGVFALVAIVGWVIAALGALGYWRRPEETAHRFKPWPPALRRKLLVWGYGLARQQPVMLWVPPLGMRHAASLLTLVSFVLLAATVWLVDAELQPWAAMASQRATCTSTDRLVPK